MKHESQFEGCIFLFAGPPLRFGNTGSVCGEKGRGISVGAAGFRPTPGRSPRRRRPTGRGQMQTGSQEHGDRVRALDRPLFRMRYVATLLMLRVVVNWDGPYVSSWRVEVVMTLMLCYVTHTKVRQTLYLIKLRCEIICTPTKCVIILKKASMLNQGSQK